MQSSTVPLFVLYSGLIMKKVNHKVGHNWVQQALSAYADDQLFFWTYETGQALERIGGRTGLCWKLLEEMGMSSQQQCQAIFTCRATNSETIKKERGKVFQFQARYTTQTIPITTHTQYFRTTVSYSNCEDSTLSHRMKMAQHTYWRLQKTINSKRALGVRHRLQLWHATVWSALSYGLHCSGITNRGHKRLQTMVMKHIRACAGKPVHLTRINNKDLLKQYQLQTLLQNILGILTREEQRVNNNTRSIPT